MKLYFRQKIKDIEKDAISMFESTAHKQKIKNAQKQERKQIGNIRQACFCVMFLFYRVLGTTFILL